MPDLYATPKADFIDDAPRRQRYEKLFDRLFTIRKSGWDSHWREVSDFMRPRRSRFWTGDRNRGDRRNQNIIDSTARFSSRTLQSGMHGGVTSPARPWMKLTTPDPSLAKHPPVKEWLHEVTQRMLVLFGQTNIYKALPVVYGDMGDYGTAAMAILDDRKDLFRAYTYPLGSYAVGLDARGMVSTFAYEVQMSVRQVIEKFALDDDGRTILWERLSPHIKNLWGQGDYEENVDVCWLVVPNDDHRPERLEARFLPWRSCWWEKGQNAPKFLRESGFRVFPFFVPRWEVTDNDNYGTDCPGMTALGDVKQLQIEQRRKGQAISKMVDPPLVGPSALRTQKTSLLPGDVTYVDIREGSQGLKAIHEIGLNLEHLARDIGEVQYRIQRAYFEDLFLMLARSDDRLGADRPTATEIVERKEEKMIILGPVLEQINDELLDPMVDRAYEMMDLAGLIPEAPPELAGVRLKVEYTSILAQAQKLVGVAGADRFVGSMIPIIQVEPIARHKVDWLEVVDGYGDMLGVPPQFLRTTEEARELAQQEAAQQKQLVDAQAAESMGRAVKDASGASMEGDTALNRIVTGAAAQAGA
jgi:hypothetical protein